MTSLLLADAEHLLRWANSRRAQEQLPLLIRRLIHATTSTATHVGLPAGDSIQQRGYDGIVVIDEEHHVVPNGVSIWELGTSSNPKRKADEDYDNRKRAQPVGPHGPIDPSRTTFVFVTPRRWNGKNAWAEQRRAEGFWRDVRVLAADDLEAWLQLAPATHVWFSNHIGVRPMGAEDLESVWLDWSEATDPPLSPGLMLAGRDELRDKLRAWFSGEASEPIIAVESESPQEALALVAASVMSLPEEQRAAVLARAIVARDEDALTRVSAADESLRILTRFAPHEAAHRATRRGHRILIPSGPGETVAGTMRAPRLRRDEARRELESMGLPADRARDLAGLARRSLMALRRRLASSAAVSRPAWATGDVGPTVLPILFLGAVNDSVQADRDALALLSRETSEASIARLARLAAEADPPVRRVGSVWYIVSKEDAWEALSRYITRDFLERFVTVAVGVLGTPDPAYELPLEQRWAAGLYDKKRANSGLLLQSVADTLALVGARGAAHSVAAGVTAADYAPRVVCLLFDQAARDWRRWASLAPMLSRLIEASPDATLAAIEAGLRGQEPSPVLGLFGHDTDAMFSSSPHTNLLWALELAAWSPHFLSRSALLLAELVRRAPEGKLLNRPEASLRSIFLPWLPGTTAPIEARLAVIDAMREREPNASWIVMGSLLPKAHDTKMSSGRPTWRDWAPEAETRVTSPNIYEHAVAIVGRMLDDAGTDGERWARLIETLDDIPVEAHERIIGRLGLLSEECALPDAARQQIWTALRSLVSRHRSFPEAEWALPADRVDEVATFLAKFEPSDPVTRDSYLFSHSPELPEGREQDYESNQNAVSVHQLEAARTWYKGIGINEIVRVSATLDRADALGDALARTGIVTPEDELQFLKLGLSHADRRARAAARAYVSRRFGSRGVSGVIAFTRAREGEWAPTISAEALLSTAPGPDVWAEIDTLGPEAQSHYWRDVPTHWIEGTDSAAAIRKLIDHGRPHAAVDLVALSLHREPKPSVDVALRVLRAAVPVASDVTGYRSDTHDVSELVSFLEGEAEAGRVDEQNVAQLELTYLPLLRYSFQPKLLHKAMAQGPAMFIEATCLAFRGEGEAELELDETSRSRARLAYDLLSSWRTPPGLEDGVVHGARLNAWVDEARRGLRDANRAAIGDELIGQVLSGSPAGQDGRWPAEPVRDLVERLASDHLEAGLRVGRFNQRGVISRNPLAGGDMERGIGARYESDASAMAIRWPRTAAFLRSFASSYGRDAAREDAEAELWQDLDN